jgi:hypothetical protein
MCGVLALLSYRVMRTPALPNQDLEDLSRTVVGIVTEDQEFDAGRPAPVWESRNVCEPVRMTQSPSLRVTSAFIADCCVTGVSRTKPTAEGIAGRLFIRPQI